jgi:hypothetical protein
MKNKTFHTVRTVPKYNRKIIGRGKINTHSTPIHDHSLYWLGTGSSINSNKERI